MLPIVAQCDQRPEYNNPVRFPSAVSGKGPKISIAVISIGAAGGGIGFSGALISFPASFRVKHIVHDLHQVLVSSDIVGQ